ncbi:trypsin-like peptidase domain-containing protein [Patescibacteria group bacterium]|nr:trypsin-like peptidase domain-containing protein [Patescibacteria group bacterium]
MRKLVVLLVILVIFLGLWSGTSIYLPTISSKLKFLEPSQSREVVKVVTEQSAIIDAVKKVGPSVVTVTSESSQTSDLRFGPFFIFGAPDQQGNQAQQNIGSGFIVSSDGQIVTNKHVVSNPDAKFTVTLSNGKNYSVKNVFRDPANDIAILKIDPAENSDTELKPVIMGDSSKLQVGQFVIAIGTALGEFRNSVTRGIISGIGRGITAGDSYQGYAEQLDNVIQTDAAINLGNSGGPLVNSDGQVIGVNTAVASGSQNIGFALPINVVKESLSNFSQHGQFERPYLGVSYVVISKQTALANNVAQGAYVQGVVKDSSADKGGLKTGDIITKIDGKNVGDSNDNVAKAISGKKVGDSMTLTIWRDGKILEVKTTLGNAPSQ